MLFSLSACYCNSAFKQSLNSLRQIALRHVAKTAREFGISGRVFRRLIFAQDTCFLSALHYSIRMSAPHDLAAVASRHSNIQTAEPSSRDDRPKDMSEETTKAETTSLETSEAKDGAPAAFKMTDQTLVCDATRCKSSIWLNRNSAASANIPNHHCHERCQLLRSTVVPRSDYRRDGSAYDFVLLPQWKRIVMGRDGLPRRVHSCVAYVWTLFRYLREEVSPVLSSGSYALLIRLFRVVLLTAVTMFSVFSLACALARTMLQLMCVGCFPMAATSFLGSSTVPVADLP